MHSTFPSNRSLRDTVSTPSGIASPAGAVGPASMSGAGAGAASPASALDPARDLTQPLLFKVKFERIRNKSIATLHNASTAELLASTDIGSDCFLQGPYPAGVSPTPISATSTGPLYRGEWLDLAITISNVYKSAMAIHATRVELHPYDSLMPAYPNPPPQPAASSVASPTTTPGPAPTGASTQAAVAPSASPTRPGLVPPGLSSGTTGLLARPVASPPQVSSPAPPPPPPPPPPPGHSRNASSAPPAPQPNSITSAGIGSTQPLQQPAQQSQQTQPGHQQPSGGGAAATSTAISLDLPPGALPLSSFSRPPTPSSAAQSITTVPPAPVLLLNDITEDTAPLLPGSSRTITLRIHIQRACAYSLVFFIAYTDPITQKRSWFGRPILIESSEPLAVSLGAYAWHDHVYISEITVTNASPRSVELSHIAFEPVCMGDDNHAGDKTLCQPTVMPLLPSPRLSDSELSDALQGNLTAKPTLQVPRETIKSASSSSAGSPTFSPAAPLSKTETDPLTALAQKKQAATAAAATVAAQASRAPASSTAREESNSDATALKETWELDEADITQITEHTLLPGEKVSYLFQVDFSRVIHRLVSVTALPSNCYYGSMYLPAPAEDNTPKIQLGRFILCWSPRPTGDRLSPTFGAIITPQIYSPASNTTPSKAAGEVVSESPPQAASNEGQGNDFTRSHALIDKFIRESTPAAVSPFTISIVDAPDQCSVGEVITVTCLIRNNSSLTSHDPAKPVSLGALVMELGAHAASPVLSPPAIGSTALMSGLNASHAGDGGLVYSVGHGPVASSGMFPTPLFTPSTSGQSLSLVTSASAMPPHTNAIMSHVNRPASVSGAVLQADPFNGAAYCVPAASLVRSMVATSTSLPSPQDSPASSASSASALLLSLARTAVATSVATAKSSIPEGVCLPTNAAAASACIALAMTPKRAWWSNDPFVNPARSYFLAAHAAGTLPEGPSLILTDLVESSTGASMPQLGQKSGPYIPPTGCSFANQVPSCAVNDKATVVGVGVNPSQAKASVATTTAALLNYANAGVVQITPEHATFLALRSAMTTMAFSKTKTLTSSHHPSYPQIKLGRALASSAQNETENLASPTALVAHPSSGAVPLIPAGQMPIRIPKILPGEERRVKLQFYAASEGLSALPPLWVRVTVLGNSVSNSVEGSLLADSDKTGGARVVPSGDRMKAVIQSPNHMSQAQYLVDNVAPRTWVVPSIVLAHKIQIRPVSL